MFKFKMSLLLQNVKFRVAVILVIISAVLAGIVFIPKNKASNMSNEVYVVANKSGVTANGKNYCVVRKSGNATGYNTLFCIEQDANLVTKTYSAPKNFSEGSDYFESYNSAMWLINNMYITGITGQGGISNDTAKEVMALNFANLLTTNTVKEKVAAERGLDTSSITAQKVFNLRNKSLNKKSNENVYEFAEQVALWKYTKNVGNSFTKAYVDNTNQMLSGTDLSNDEQVTLKYIVYALRVLADMNSEKATPANISNCVVLNKENAKFNSENYKVGPYYLQANGIKLTSYSFGNATNGAIPASATITKNDGTTVTASTEVFVKNDDGSFYVDLSNYKDAQKVDIKLESILSNISTEAYILDGGNKQNLLTLEKSVGVTSLTDSKTISIPGEYNVVICKVKNDGKTIITSSEATFNVNGKDLETERGRLNFVQGKKIANANQNDVYEIKETKAPNGFKASDETGKLNVFFKQEGNKYVIDTDKTEFTGIKNASFVVTEDKATIRVCIPNEELPGRYSVELYKTNENGEVIKTPAKFDINGKEKETENGKIEIASNVEVKDEDTVGTYTIKETGAPEHYVLFDKTLELSVKMDKINDILVLKEKGITLKVKENDDKFVIYSADEMKKANVKVVLDGTTIKVYVPNNKQVFDLALRKYISAINGEKVDPSREPIINEKSIKMLEETGTASYYHTKNSIGVRVGDLVEYTIRVYNEGEILGFAKQITDYLPDGLSFVKLADDNSKEFTTKTAEGSKVVVIDYSGNTTIKSLRDFFGKKDINVTSDYYQQVKIICKVLDTEKTYITNRGEITNYGYEEKDEKGNIVWKEAKEIKNVDLDSVEDTIKDNLDLDNWYENAKEKIYKDENGNEIVDNNYYPGVQDDDDFETVELLKGKYTVIIKKVDSKDKNKTLEGAYFSVSGSNLEKEKEVGPTGKDGLATLVKGVKIESEKQNDKYVIKETKAPVNYKLYAGNITLNIATKLDNGIFVIDEKNTKIDKKDVEFVVNSNNTTITIVIPDNKKEFDLSLRKFITDVNDQKVDPSREPQVDISKLAKGEATTATYNHPKDPVDVNPKDIVTYTIRVYNEGEIDGYASKVMDDVPEGLELVPAEYDETGKPLNTNAQYRWVAYKEVEKQTSENVISYNNKFYAITDNVKEADLIVTDYLAKSNGTDKLLKAFNPSTMKELDYKDVKVAFKVVEAKTSDRIITNYAQITDDTDSDGNKVEDRDSTPNEWNEGEDDQDIDNIKLRYFDLALRKWVTKAIVYENGVEKVTETNHGPFDDPEPVVKVDLKNTSIDSVVVKFEYSIRIYNQGQIEGYAKEISDYIPQGLKFVAEDNPQWKEVDGKIVTNALENTLLQPGEYADVTVLLTWINGTDNLGLKVNTAEISKDYNEYDEKDIDSTPNNLVEGEDDIDDAPVILAVRTGEPIIYTGIAVTALGIISIGAYVVKRRILK